MCVDIVAVVARAIVMHSNENYAQKACSLSRTKFLIAKNRNFQSFLLG